jgi:pimeloyl-ACP methyl ester carboxylesterase
VVVACGQSDLETCTRFLWLAEGLARGRAGRPIRIVAPVVERSVPTNGIELHVLERGEGPLVVLCHGFPELGYSWRHQVEPLANAGHRVVVPDMRGYGRSSAPAEVEAYDIVSLCRDMCGLLDALGEERGVFVGHDWGANVAWWLAVLHPARVRAVAGLSVPFVPRAPAAPIPIMREHLGEDFYIVWFQRPGVADAALASDVRRTLTTSRQWTARWAEEDLQRPPRRQEWLSEQELSVYVNAFERTGFTGGLNWYRNIDRNWELTEPVAEQRVEQPAMFLTGELDPVRSFMPAEAMQGWVTDLREEVILPGAGHWVQQQEPPAVNGALLRFLGGL